MALTIDNLKKHYEQPFWNIMDNLKYYNDPDISATMRFSKNIFWYNHETVYLYEDNIFNMVSYDIDSVARECDIDCDTINKLFKTLIKKLGINRIYLRANGYLQSLNNEHRQNIR